MEHSDDILCLTINQHPKFPNVVATGQVGMFVRLSFIFQGNVSDFTLEPSHMNDTSITLQNFADSRMVLNCKNIIYFFADTN